MILAGSPASRVAYSFPRSFNASSPPTILQLLMSISGVITTSATLRRLLLGDVQLHNTRRIFSCMKINGAIGFRL